MNDIVSPLDGRYRTEMSAIFGDKAKLDRWMDVEIALAKAHAKLGNIPKEAVAKIESAKGKVKLERVHEIESEIHHDLMAMVKAMSEQAGDAGAYIHLGSTSYDIEDTATALIFMDAIELTEKRLIELRKVLKELALKHKKTVCMGRTHGQHATPTTYGMKFAIYFQEAGRNLERLKEAKKRILVGKMSGAVGTMATFRGQGEKIEKMVMDELGLKAAPVATQVVQRDRHAEILNILALCASGTEKIAKELRNLQRTEILEIAESFGKKQVGSSTMPHKRNPHKSERVCSLSRIVRANVAVSLENIALEHERDLTNSANERFVFSESFIVLDFMHKEITKLLSGLEFFPENIKKNLELTNGLIMAERLMIAITEKGFLGRQEAHEAVREMSIRAFKEKKHLKEVFSASELGKKFRKAEIDDLFDYSSYIGEAEKIVERALKD
ncbi:adenylosuccinate lyase [Candidatus Micrarchaeota archaeon]|nr:adenylosuccinate lyase [Candidatus Micrarchaeota archaeon]